MAKQDTGPGAGWRTRIPPRDAASMLTDPRQKCPSLLCWIRIPWRKEQRESEIKEYAGPVSQYKGMPRLGRKNVEAVAFPSREPLPQLLPPRYPWQQMLRGSLVWVQRPKCPDTWPLQELLLITTLLRQNVLSLEDPWMSCSFYSTEKILNTLGWKKEAQSIGNTHTHTHTQPAKEARSRYWGWTLSVKLALRTKLLRGQGRERGKAWGISPKTQGKLSSRKRLSLFSEIVFLCQSSP